MNKARNSDASYRMIGYTCPLFELATFFFIILFLSPTVAFAQDTPTYLTTPSYNGVANPELRSQALELFSEGLRCPIPNSYGGSYNEVNEFLGDEDVVLLTARRRDAEMDRGKFLNNTFIDQYSARWPDFFLATTNDNYIHLECKYQRKCVRVDWAGGGEVISNGAAASVPMHPYGGTQDYQLSITLCDSVTASRVKRAAEVLIKSAGGTLGELYTVADNASGGILNLRSGPSTQNQIIVAVPVGTKDVRLGECRASHQGAMPWCEAEWRGQLGWMSGCCLINNQTGVYAKDNYEIVYTAN